MLNFLAELLYAFCVLCGNKLCHAPPDAIWNATFHQACVFSIREKSLSVYPMSFDFIVKIKVYQWGKQLFYMEIIQNKYIAHMEKESYVTPHRTLVTQFVHWRRISYGFTCSIWLCAWGPFLIVLNYTPILGCLVIRNGGTCLGSLLFSKPYIRLEKVQILLDLKGVIQSYKIDSKSADLDWTPVI